MKKQSRQRPRKPVEADSYIYDPELSSPEPPDRVVAIPGELDFSEELDSPRLKKFRDVESKLVNVLFGAVVIFSISLTTIMFAQVLLRYVFKSPFVGIEEVALLFGAWLYFLGFVCVTRNGEHIHGGVLTLIVKQPNTIRTVRFVMSILTTVGCAIFGFYAIKYALFEIQTGRLSSYMRWPKGLWSSSLIVGFSGTFIYLIFQMVNQVLDLRHHLSIDRRARDD